MYTIIDYLKFYSDASLNEVKWNNIDNLMAAIIVYLPIPSFKDNKSLKELCDYATKNETDIRGFTATKAVEILNIIKNSKRYKNITISNFINVKNEDSQFGACIIKTDKEKIISFKGTDRSLIGWLENFRLMYEYPTYTQNLAIKYLNDNITFIDKDIYVVGHSKGGNLAMASAMELSYSKFNKIKEVCNFDGPGFKKQEYESKKFKRPNF